MCTWLGVGNDARYTPTSTFETFPFPYGLTPNLPLEAYSNEYADAITTAVVELLELRENWLNPKEWVSWSAEVIDGYPDRISPIAGYEEEVKKRTVTNLYNENPAWLVNAHAKLDEAVAAAYGWPVDLSDDEILANLLELNLSRSGATGDGELPLQ